MPIYFKSELWILLSLRVGSLSSSSPHSPGIRNVTETDANAVIPALLTEAAVKSHHTLSQSTSHHESKLGLSLGDKERDRQRGRGMAK